MDNIAHAKSTEGIQFREIANEELAEAYHRMEEWGRENSCLKKSISGQCVALQVRCFPFPTHPTN